MRIKKSKEILLFFDTNILYDSKEDCTKFEFGIMYDRIKEYIKVNKYNQFKIVIPRIVIEELTKHKIDNFISKRSYTLSKSKENDKFYTYIDQLGYECRIIENRYSTLKQYKHYIRTMRDKYLKSEGSNFEIVEYSNGININNVIRRAINKQKPFFEGHCNQKKFTDAGFKDVVFLESVKMYLKKHNCEYIVFTNDNYLLEIDINKEITNRNGEVKDLLDKDLIVNYLNEKYDLKDYSDYIKFINNDYFDNCIEEKLNCKIIEKNLELTEEKDEYDNNLYGIKLQVLINGALNKIIVYIDGEKNFVSAFKEENQELFFSW